LETAYNQVVEHKSKASFAEESVSHIEQKVDNELKDIKLHYEKELRYF